MVTIFEDATLVSAGVDWITATAKEVDVCEQLLAIGKRTITLQEGCGYFGRATGFQGYSGYGVEGCFAGTRPDGVCLRVSGDTAHHLAEDLARIPVSITRIDLQATVVLPADIKEYGNAFIEAYRAESQREDANPKRHTKLVDAGSHGSTVYLGSRAAAFYGRIYDKARETDGSYAPGTWRIESECKRRLAPAIFAYLGGLNFLPEAIISLIKSQWAKRGVHVALPTQLDVSEPVIPRVSTDVERRLEWLRRVARPVLIRLHEAGYEVEAANAIYGWLMPDETASNGQ